MTILYTSTQVHQAIKRLFADSKGRRVVISAFVGSEANAYLPKPKGIELICWPKAGGTNPNAIRDLIDRGVKVFFANAVHMKIYWTSDRGAVITSANLSTNALGADGLKEIGVLLPKGKVEIDKIIRSLSIHAVPDSDLLKLDKEHKAYYKKNPQSQAKKPTHLITFDKWYDSPGRSAWKLGWYWPGKVNLAEESKAVLEKEHGSLSCDDILDYSEDFFRKDDWLLCFSIANNKVRWIEWIFAHHVVKTSSPAKRPGRSQKSYQILQVNKLKTYTPPLFQLDKKFRNALVKAVKDFGGVVKIDELRTANPPKKLVDLIYKHYMSKR